MMFPRPLTLLILLLLPAPCVLAAADDSEGVRQPRHTELRDSVRRVERETGGRVLRVEPVRRGGQETYRMKVLTPEGRVRVMQDNQREERRRGMRSEPPGGYRDE